MSGFFCYSAAFSALRRGKTFTLGRSILHLDFIGVKDKKRLQECSIVLGPGSLTR